MCHCKDIIVECCESSKGIDIPDGVITIGLALVAALIALFQARANIIAKARTIWIDNLRNNVSEFIQGSLTVVFKREEGIKENSFSEKFRTEESQLGITANKILLLLNDNKDGKHPKHKEATEIIEEILLIYSRKEPKATQVEMGLQTRKLRVVIQHILKEEWSKSKKWIKI